MNNLKSLVIELSVEICKVIELIEEIDQKEITVIDLADAVNTETIKLNYPCIMTVPDDLITIINGKFVKLIKNEEYNINHNVNLYAPENITFEELEDLLLGGTVEDIIFKQEALKTPELYEVVIDRTLYKYNSAKFNALKKYGDKLNYIYIRRKTDL